MSDKSKAIPASFHGQIRTTRGGRFRIDNLRGRAKDKVHEVVVETPKQAVRGATIDKAQARRDKKAAERKLAGLIRARLKITDPKKAAAADKAIDKFKDDNGL